MTRLLVTGSRHWTDRETIRQALLQVWSELGCKRDTVLVHGACPYGGADIIADQIWAAAGMPVEPHPADWKRHGKAAGPIRNQEMVDLGADVCAAFPLPDSRGTYDCMARADRARIPVRPFGEGHFHSSRLRRVVAGG